MKSDQLAPAPVARDRETLVAAPEAAGMGCYAFLDNPRACLESLQHGQAPQVQPMSPWA